MRGGGGGGGVLLYEVIRDVSLKLLVYFNRNSVYMGLISCLILIDRLVFSDFLTNWSHLQDMLSAKGLKIVFPAFRFGNDTNANDYFVHEINNIHAYGLEIS